MSQLYKVQFYFVLSLITLIFSLNSTIVWGVEQASKYVSQADRDITLQKISTLPFTDNMSGIYAQPLEDYLKELITQDHAWNYNPLKSTPPTGVDLDNFLEDAKKIQEFGIQNEVDGFINGRLTKGPKGISLFLNLYLRSDGLLLVQEKILDYNQFELRNLKEQIKILYTALKKKLPYSGLILSRQHNRVTLNLGKKDGMAPEQTIDIVQIIKLNRHPKYQFIISTDTEILGKVKIVKVEDTLSFGIIINEKERGVIERSSKVGRLGFIEYSDTGLSLGLNADDNLSERPDSQIAFGKNPEEWAPKTPPSFGKFGILAGLGSFASNMNLTGYGALTGTSPIYPSFSIYGEFWLSSYWQLELGIRSAILGVKNPMAESSPSYLNLALNQYRMHLGYNMLFEDFFGPKVQLLMGFSTYAAKIDESNPTSLTSLTYSGLNLGFRGYFPITPKRTWALGAELFWYITPTLTERPNSGSSTNTINQFGGFCEYKHSEHILFKGRVDFELFSTNFSNPTARTVGSSTYYASDTSHSLATISGGIEYLF